MKQIYLDNGSTSFPKAPGVGAVMGNHIDTNGYNISRGSYERAYGIEEVVIDTKEQLCTLFNVESISNIIFTSGATVSLNMIIKGLLKSGDHVITSSMEHNAVARPIYQLTKDGIEWSEAKCDERGMLNFKNVEDLIKPNTKLVIITHASNVCGTILPIKEVGEICKKHKVWFAVDAAQTAGSELIDMKACGISALAFPGHKSLLGPQGIGGLILSKAMAEEIKPLIAGGTGSLSDKITMPDFLPDKFQAGTLNIPGIIGLNHALKFIEKTGEGTIKARKDALTKQFLEGVLNMNKEDVKLIGLPTLDGRCSVISLDFQSADNAEVSFTLEKEHGIMTRCGMHCAPRAHKTLRTFPQGTVRFSIGYFTEEGDIIKCLNAIKDVIMQS